MIVRIVLLFFATVGTAFAAPAADRFAYEAPIALDGTTSVYRTSLPAAVYAGATRSDLGDLRVFNAGGEAVPHALARPAPEPQKRVANLPLFPLVLGDDSPRGDVSLRVELRKDGSIVKVDGKQPSETGKRIYLLDVTSFDEPLRALAFEWQANNAANRLRHVNIEASDDLKQWQTVVKGTLAKLQHEGQRLERNRVELPARRMKYLRVVPSDGDDLMLSRVEAEFVPTIESVRNWIAPTPQPSSKSGEQPYVLDGKMTVDRARLDLAPNSVARVTILYRARDGDAWMQAGHKTVYRLETSGIVIKDEEIPFGRHVAAAQWLVRQTPSSANGATVAALSLGWVAHDLVFVAQGEPPFSLAYGRHGLQPVDYGVNELLRLAKRGEQRVAIGDATLGAPVERMGERARRAGWTADWHTWVLWAVLILGVGALALFAVRLGGRIRTEGRKE